jgi:hypothetical protein
MINSLEKLANKDENKTTHYILLTENQEARSAEYLYTNNNPKKGLQNYKNKK